MVDIPEPIEFEWDKSNIDKSYEKHGISPKDAEQIFLDPGLSITDDINHSQKEKRYIALGVNRKRQLLICFFTIRKNKIRIISARRANQKERRYYEKKT